MIAKICGSQAFPGFLLATISLRVEDRAAFVAIG